MNGVKVIIGILFLSIFFTSCDDDSYDLGNYWVNLATVSIADNNTAYFLLDNGKSLYNGENPPAISLSEGDRVWLNYTYLDVTTPGFDNTIKINWITPVTRGELRGVSKITADTLKNDPIILQSVWTGSHFLNISFSFNFHSVPHTISLVTDSLEVNDKNISIYFRHNINNDPEGSKRNVIASFDLEKVLGPPQKDRKLFVNLNTDNYGNKTFELDY